MKNFNSDSYRLEILSENKYSLWDEFIKNTPQYNIFASSFWLKTISEAIDKRYEIIGCFQNGELIAGCVGYIKNTYEGKSFALLPLTPYNSVFLKPLDNSKESQYLKIIENIIDFLEQNFDWIIIYLHPSIKDVRHFIWRGWDACPRYTYYISLGEKQEFYNRIDDSILRRLKKAKDLGFSVSEAELDLEHFYFLWEKTFRRQNIKPLIEKQRFLKVYHALSDENLLRIFTVESKLEGKLGYIIFLIDRDTVYYWLAVSEPSKLNMGFNQLLLVESLIRLSDSGIQILDFVGSDIPSIAAYKSKFGPELITHYRVSKAITHRAKIIRRIKHCYKILTRC